MTPALPLLDAALRGALLATLLLLGVALARERSAHPAARVGMALMAGLAVQTIGALPLIERGCPILWQAPLVGVSVGNAVLFWLFARALFDDEFRVRPWHRAVWGVVALVGAGFCLSLAAFGAQAGTTVVLRIALRWLPAVFAALVIVAVASQWRGDLVEPRRRLRGVIVAGGSAYALAMVVVRLASPQGRLSAPAAGVDSALLLCILAAAGVTLLRLTEGRLLVPAVRAEAAPAVPPAGLEPPDALDAKIAAGLDRLMTVDQAYRIDDLTLGVLAIKLGVPEYRLRRFINQRLGHRNFNAYVNGWRLADARSALADPTRRTTGVLEIAMEAGFASIGPFNRAFKAESGVTPSEFRRRALADS